MNTIITSLKFLLQPSWANGTDMVQAYERAFSQTIVGSDVPALSFGQGRVALWTILRAAGVTKQTEVLLPAYTCETVPMAVKFAGAKCVYVDVEQGQFNASVRCIADAFTDQTKIVICQHTYGIIQPVKKMILLAKRKQAILIEDRCHLIQNDFGQEDTLTLGHAAVFSTHYNKPFSTGQGGMAIFGDHKLYSKAKNIRCKFAQTDAQQRGSSLALQMLLYNLAVRPTTRTPIANMYRRAQRSGFIHGTISVEEYGETMPSDYLLAATNFHAIFGIAQLHKWDINSQHRQHLTRFYIEQLSLLGVDVSPLMVGSANPILLSIPVLVKNKQEILRRAAKKGLPIACWFDRMPAHICPSTAYRYDYRPGQCPRTEKLISKEIHLLTAPCVTLRQAIRAIGLIKRYAHLAVVSPKLG